MPTSLLLRLYEVEGVAHDLTGLFQVLESISNNVLLSEEVEELSAVLIFLSRLGKSHASDLLTWVERARVFLMANVVEAEEKEA